jgi:murein DD-endopeptidase MepM/ murein hydrolase activator NlpD
VVGLLAEVARAMAAVSVVAVGALLIAGHVRLVEPEPANAAAHHAGFLAYRDTLALLRKDGFAGHDEDEVTTMLLALRPTSLLAGQFAAAAESLTAQVRRLAATPSIMPTQGWLTSRFSRRRFHPILLENRPHIGIDVRAPFGTPIEAPAAGTVIHAGWEGGYGRSVVIDHDFGIVTRYAHASRLLVEPGQRVQRGEVIALVGRTGLAEVPHLHYEVHVHGRPVDPLRFVLPGVIAD